MNGCTELSLKGPIILKAGTLLDRIGPTDGRFVAFIQRDIRTELPKPASYASRSLRTLGETPYWAFMYGKKVDLREKIYKMIYTSTNDKENKLYYVLQLEQDLEVTDPCKAAKAFGYPGGALQLGLPSTVQKLIDDGILKKLTPVDMKYILGEDFPRFPPYTDPDDGIEAAFRPYNRSLYPIMEQYYSTEEMRAKYRNEQALPPTPAPKAGNATPVKVVPGTAITAPAYPSPLLSSSPKKHISKVLFQSPSPPYRGPQ
jgi:hypothetical protein